MSHLGERITPLVDGQLGVDAAERALMHLAGCRECRDAVEVERLTKQRLASLGVPPPSGDLMQRLAHMAGPSGPLPPRPGHVPGSPRPQLTSASGLGSTPAGPGFVGGSGSGFGSGPRLGDGALLGRGSVLGGGPVLGSGPVLGDGAGLAQRSAFEQGAALAATVGRPAVTEVVVPSALLDDAGSPTNLRLTDAARSVGPAGAGMRPPGRRGSSRPPLVRASTVSRMVRVSRSSRNRMAAAMVGAVCLVGAGVAGGVANGGVADQRISPPVDFFVHEHGVATSTLPFSDQTISWGSVVAGR